MLFVQMNCIKDSASIWFYFHFFQMFKYSHGTHTCYAYYQRATRTSTLPSNVLVTKMFFKGPHRLLFDNCAIIISSLPRLQSHEQCRLLVVHIVRSQTLGVAEKHSTSSIKVHKKQSHELALSQWSYMYRLVVSIVSQTEAEKKRN